MELKDVGEVLCTQAGWERKIKMEDSVSSWDEQCPEVCEHIPS